MGIADQIDLLLTLTILVVGLGTFIKIRNVDIEKLKKRAISEKGVSILWMDSTLVGVSFLIHQIIWTSKIFLDMNTGMWFDATKTLFIASLAFLTFTWYEIIRDSTV